LARKTAIRWSNIAESKVGQANAAKIARLWPAKGAKKSKFNNIETVVDGIHFDSQGEADRYCHLKRFERQGLIKDLRLQVPFELTPTLRDEAGKITHRAMNYIADFVYFNNVLGREVVEDFKGRRTRTYIDKSKQMAHKHGIIIYETTVKNNKEFIL
jgi:hypothetical protein